MKTSMSRRPTVKKTRTWALTRPQNDSSSNDSTGRLIYGPGPNERLIDWPFSTLVGERPKQKAINFWGERPRTFGVNGYQLLGWTASNFWGERPRTSGVNGQKFLISSC